MHFQAIFLILIIFVSYLILGNGGNSSKEAISGNEVKIKDVVKPSFKDKISNMIVGAIIIANQGANNLEIEFNKFITLAKEIGQKNNSEDNNDKKVQAETIKDFRRLSPEEYDSQIAVYKINIEKTEIEVGSNGTKCEVKNDDSLLKSRTALIKYLDYNFNLFDFNSAKRWPIASISKLMTAVITLEKIGVEKEIKISATAVATEGIAGSFKVGEIFKAEDLIKAMLVVSSNDAAMALAEDFGKENFIELMNQKAKELGMNNTYYEEPTGLSFLNQSTADDLVKLTNYIYNNYPQILEISRQKEVFIKELKLQKERKLLNINRFAWQADFIGGKTGYIDESSRNLVAFFNKNNKVVLTIVLGAENAFEETKKMLQCY